MPKDERTAPFKDRYLQKLEERGIPVTVSGDGKRAEIRSRLTDRILYTVSLQD